MPVPNENTCELMRLIERNDALYADCVRIAGHALEEYPPRSDGGTGVRRFAAGARADLGETLRSVILYAGDPAIREHLRQARVDWRDVAREFLAGVIS